MAESVKTDILTVSQITRRVKNLLEAEIGRVWVSGEISNWRVSPAGHAYFTLKDENSQIDCVMFRGRMSRVQFQPESGIEVVVQGQVSVYERRGNYQIICEDMHPKGLGALQLAFEQLRKKLEEEGLFAEEHKKPLPMLPRRIGIVTSPTGAAIRDILNVIGRRYANVHILLCPARVQGDKAKDDLVRAIRMLDDYGVDVMIVGRGGGSLEDLWPFNEEAVVRAVFDAKTPIISAVGHEIDFALTDFAADVRAPTPSAAAELVVCEHEELKKQVDRLGRGLARAAAARVEAAGNRLKLAQSSYVFRRPEELLRQRRQFVDDCRMRLEQYTAERLRDRRTRLASASRSLALLSPVRQLRQTRQDLCSLQARLGRAAAAGLERSRSRLGPLTGRLNALSPLAVLSRGYALAWKTGPDGQDERVLVRDAAQLNENDHVLVQFGKGSAETIVHRLRKEES
jgi:exodeoxyribonuclease VII large subunit